jgi:hypothetical protein
MLYLHIIMHQNTYILPRLVTLLNPVLLSFFPWRNNVAPCFCSDFVSPPVSIQSIQSAQMDEMVHLRNVLKWFWCVIGRYL